MVAYGCFSFMIRVGVNGYGTIGKRVADAVEAQPDMELIGVAKTQPNFEAHTAVERGYPMYAAIPERSPLFAEAGIDIAGEVDELVAEADVIVDCTPSGIGAQNRELYETHHTPAIFQGGEDSDVADVSFNARSNFDAARDADYVRVVSCNTTGLSRIIAPLEEEYGVDKVRATLVRRGGDPGQNSRGPINDILPNPIKVPSHHGPDVKTIFPDLEIDTLGLKVPATLMHVHALNVTLEDDVTGAHVRQLLEGEDRVYVIPEGLGIDGAGKLKDFALDAGRPRGDMWENCVWGESIGVNGRDLYLFQAIHQESDVIPENIDAIRAMFDTEDKRDSMELTDRTLGVGISGDPSGFSEQARAEFADD
ncbi:glyceraldehyde-3-phosphate dehydrogenase [Haloferax mediterranei ATCC 33500]|uniref:Glyceraldehyde-3-phosphate dehydrogenase n=2 Tax=Haloferax mediterranei (strain ATCC 33500 / DSM 1411 / JCM 8866 / NBRC 14739 / NCIMB 2177 / R-4) TaxID=523841 RepID=M0J0B7_HALMT|nr:glyceraldehyde-3-phosphate dehydrogenase [Haloferax mediterranei ATCC 33500]